MVVKEGTVVDRLFTKFRPAILYVEEHDRQQGKVKLSSSVLIRFVLSAEHNR